MGCGHYFFLESHFYASGFFFGALRERECSTVRHQQTAVLFGKRQCWRSSQDHLCVAGNLDSRKRGMVVSRPKCAYIYFSMVRHRRVRTHPLLSLEVATPEKKKKSKKKKKHLDAVIHTQESPLHKRFLVGCSSPFMRLAEHLAITLRAWYYASDVCLVGENPTCSVPALQGCEGPSSYDHGHA